MRIMIDIVSRAMFCTDTSGAADRVAQSLLLLQERTVERFWTVLDTSHWPTRRNRQYWQTLRERNAIVCNIVETRRIQSVAPDDLFVMLLEARDEDASEQMTHRQLRDKVMTIRGMV